MKFLGWGPEPAEGAPPTPRAVELGAAAARRLAGGNSSTRAAWQPAVLQWNRERGAAAATLARGEEVLSGGGTVVLTGQQPALGGGPLYTLYKLLTAVELAARVEAESGRPCLACFWLVGDDSDFGEISWTFWPRIDGSVKRIRDEAVPVGGSFIGRLESARQSPLLADRGNFPPGTIGEALRARTEEALRVGGNWSGATAALIYALWPELPVLFVDGAHPAVLGAQSEWLAAAASWPIPALLFEGIAEAERLGHRAVLAPELGERALFRVTGDAREPLTTAPAAGQLLAPNVVLRPLVQDLLLPNIATICGPAEVRYRAQLGPLYRRAGIAAPALVPRLRAVLVPARREGTEFAALAADDWLALRDPDRWLDRQTDEELPEPLAARARALRDRLGHDLAELSPDLARYDASLPQLVESVRGKVEYQLARLEEGVTGKARQKLLRRDPALTHWREFVRPREGEQERSLTLMTPFLLEAGRRPEPLRTAAREHLERLAAGEKDAAAVFELRPDETKEAT